MSNPVALPHNHNRGRGPRSWKYSIRNVTVVVSAYTQFVGVVAWQSPGSSRRVEKTYMRVNEGLEHINKDVAAGLAAAAAREWHERDEAGRW